MTDIHSCSYYCDRPECVKAQRDELRERLAQAEQPSDLDWWKARAIQAERLVEKFGQPEQELVVKWDASAPLVVHPHPAFQAAPPQRKPLTDEEIKNLWIQYRAALPRYLCFARAIEAAHGIKGEA